MKATQIQGRTSGYACKHLFIGLLLLGSLSLSAFSQVLAHRYSFSEAPGSATVPDSVGTAHGTLLGTGSFDGNGNLSLTGVDGYVDLGANLIAGETNIAVEAWVSFGANNGWARLFDFGDTDPITGAGSYGMDFIPHTGDGNNRSLFEVFDTNPGNNHAPGVYFSPPLDSQGKVYLVAVYDPQVPIMAIYVNGVLKASATDITILFSAFNNTHSYIGRSGYNGDPYLNATIDEFRVYASGMSAFQIAVNFAAGPSNLIASAGSLTNLNLVVESPLYVGRAQAPVAVTGDYDHVKGVNMLLFTNAVFTSANTNILRVNSDFTVTPVAVGSAMLTGSCAGLTVITTITNLAAPATNALVHQYRFDGSPGSPLTDSVGGSSWDGTVSGGADQDGSGHLILPGGAADSGNYAFLPAHLIDGYAALTFESWVTFGDNSNWARLIDFGSTDPGVGHSTFTFAPKSVGPPNTAVYFGVSQDDSTSASVYALPTLNNRSVFLTLVFNAYTHALSIYTNGILMGRNSNVNIPITAIRNDVSYLGRSIYGDPMFVGSIDEMRLFNGVRSDLQIAADSSVGVSNYVSDPGALTNIHMTVPAPLYAGSLQLAATVTGDFVNAQGVNLAFANPTLQSATPSILAVNSNTLTFDAVATGTGTLIASYGGFSVTQTVAVIDLPATLTHRYQFNESASATVFADSQGSANGQLFGAASLDGSGHLVLPGGSGGNYAEVPAHLIDGYAALTFEFWVNLGANGDWGRLVDFGDSNPGTGLGRYCIDFTPKSGDGQFVNFEVSDADPGFDHTQIVNPGPSLNNRNVHLVLVYNPLGRSMSVYTNGVVMGRNTGVTIPMSALANAHSWLGKSSYLTDPNGVATIDEFRIYNGVLSDFRVALNAASGPASYIADPGALTNLHLAVGSPVYSGQTLLATVTGDYVNLQGLNLAFANPALQSGNAAVLKVTGGLSLSAVGPGTTTLIATYGGLSATQSVTVVEVPSVLTHRYSFNETAGSTTFADSIGTANGTVIGTANLDGNGNLALPGGAAGANYAELPPNLIDGYSALTFEFWVRFGSNPNWGRLVDFGDTNPDTALGRYCIDFTPHSGNGPNGINFEISDADPGFNHTEVAAGPPVLDNLPKMHLVLVYNPPGHYMSVYTNGVLMGVNYNTSIPLTAVANSHSWLGRSSYLGDNCGVATVDEFRIYDGALGIRQIAANYAAGADALPRPQVSITKSGANVVLAWPDYISGYVVQTAATLDAGASWGPPVGTPAPVVTNGTYQVTLPISTQPAFYRLVK
jgi:hypothetical protein